MRSLVEGVVKELVISARSSTTVKRALLCRAPQLAVLFGRRDLNDKVGVRGRGSRKVWKRGVGLCGRVWMHRSCVAPAHPTSPPPNPLPFPQVLPLLITCLNAMDWALRSSFFKAVSCIGAFTGHESLDVFLLPCLEQVRGACAWQWQWWRQLGAGEGCLC